MSDGLNPTGAAQPTMQEGYETKGNPATTAPAEDASATKTAQANSNSAKTDTRVPDKQTSDQSEGTAAPLGQGIHGAPAGEEARGETDETMGRHNELDGAQMRASGEGQVADVVDRKPGATGGEESLTSDLDRKKAEQAPAREAVKEERKEKVDVAGILANRSGPAGTAE